jgi:hypothetical protein
MFQGGMDMNKETAGNGTEYKLGFNGLYYWHRDGATADNLKGSFMCPTDAMDALRRYNVSLKPLISTEVGTLDSLVTKADLLGYALLEGIEVPEKYKIPSAIKKFLQGGYK